MTLFWGFKEEDEAYNRSATLELNKDTDPFSSGRTWHLMLAPVEDGGLRFKAYRVSTTPCEVWVSQESEVSGFITPEFEIQIEENTIKEEELSKSFVDKLNQMIASSESDEGQLYWVMVPRGGYPTKED